MIVLLLDFCIWKLIAFHTCPEKQPSLGWSQSLLLLSWFKSSLLLLYHWSAAKGINGRDTPLTWVSQVALWKYSWALVYWWVIHQWSSQTAAYVVLMRQSLHNLHLPATWDLRWTLLHYTIAIDLHQHQSRVVVLQVPFKYEKGWQMKMKTPQILLMQDWKHLASVLGIPSTFICLAAKIWPSVQSSYWFEIQQPSLWIYLHHDLM